MDSLQALFPAYIFVPLHSLDYLVFHSQFLVAKGYQLLLMSLLEQ